MLVKRAAIYFALVFGAGFLLGILRVLVLVPRLGERFAELAEAPIMLAAIFLAARFVVHRYPARHSGEWLASGGIALLILVLVEFTVLLGLRGLSLTDYLAGRDPVAGVVYLVLLTIFAVLPWIIGCRQGQTR